MLIEDVAKVLECSPSKISRLENGKGIPKTRDVRDMLTAYGVTDTKLRDRLLGWASDGRQQGWWQEFSDVMHREAITSALDSYIAFEADASRKWEFQTTVFPGLLQTASYARAILKAILHNFSPQDIERLVELRLRRQDVLHRADNPLRLTCVIDEPILHRPVGGSDAMAEQLRKIIDMASRPNVDVLVLPMETGAHPAIIGSFELLEFAEGDTDHEIVHIESLTGTAHLEGELDVRRYRDVLDALIHEARDPKKSMDLIEAALDQISAKRGASKA